MIKQIPPLALLGATLLCCNFSHSASADAQQDKLDAALVKAVKANKTAEVRTLLREGANANAVGKVTGTDDDASVLKIASGDSSLKIVQMLLWRGAKVNTKTGSYQTSALLSAVGTRNVPLIKLLLKSGADVNSVEGNGWSALSIAKMSQRSSNDYAVIRLLRENGAKEVPASEG